jgi:hypothetical protein
VYPDCPTQAPERSDAKPDCPMVNLDCPIVFSTTWVPRGGPGVSRTVRREKSYGPTVPRDADLPSRGGCGGICPGYEFISIPYNDCGCGSLFVADVLDIDIMLLVSNDRKLGAIYFSNKHVNF